MIGKEIPISVIELEKIKWGLYQRVGAQFLHDLKVEAHEDFLTQNILLNIEGKILGKEMGSSTETETEHYDPIPATWWDGFKNAYFPAWLLNRFPSRMIQHTKTVTIVTKHYHVCPHLNHVSEENHLRFMGYG